MSGIPAGYRDYISKNPEKFKDYFEQRRHELGLMKSVMKSLSNEDKRRLQEYYDTHKRIEPEKFSEIIASLQSNSAASKRQRPTVGGKGRFDLEQRARNDEELYDSADLEELTSQFGDQSINDVIGGRY
jgi:hypothetical protein